jgi:hypothetical protein
METPSGPPVREKVHSRSRGGAAARRGGRTVYTTVLRIIQVVARCHWHFTHARILPWQGGTLLRQLGKSSKFSMFSFLIVSQSSVIGLST